MFLVGAFEMKILQGHDIREEIKRLRSSYWVGN